MAASNIWWSENDGCYYCRLEEDLISAESLTILPRVLGTKCVCMANGSLYVYDGAAYLKLGA